MTRYVKIYRIYLELRRQTIDLWRFPVQPQTDNLPLTTTTDKAQFHLDKDLTFSLDSQI